MNASVSYGFDVWDYVVFSISVIVSLGIGVYHAISGKKQNTTSEYLLGNRKLKVIPVALSLVVTFESSILMLGHPAEVYIYGVMIIWESLALTCAFLLAARIIVPLFYPLKITSVYEYLELRYNCSGPRLLCTGMGALFYILYMGIVLYGPALALEAAIDFPVWISMVVSAGVAMCYTAVGGIKAVVWTDVIQYIIMKIGIIAVIVQIIVVAGGIAPIWEISSDFKRLNFFDVRLNPTIRHTFWGMMIGQTFQALSLTFNQSTMQRLSSLETKEQAKRLMFIAAPMYSIAGLLVVFEGIAAFAYFNIIGCDPIESKEIGNPNQIIPFLVIRLFKSFSGLAGLYIAALYSASLSTISSGLSSLSALLIEDVVRPRFKTMSDSRLTLVAKSSVLLFGSLALGMAFTMANVGGSLIQIYGSFTAAVGGPLTGIFLYSIFFPWATSQGAIAGGLSSVVFMFWVSLGQNFSPTLHKQPWLPANPTDRCFLNDTFIANFSLNSTNNTSLILNQHTSIYNYDIAISDFWDWEPSGLDKLYSLSYQWFATVSILLVLFIGSIISLIVGKPPSEEVNAKYLLPIGDTLFPYLPRRARRFLEFGVDFEKRNTEESNEEKEKLRDDANIKDNHELTSTQL